MRLVSLIAGETLFYKHAHDMIQTVSPYDSDSIKNEQAWFTV